MPWPWTKKEVQVEERQASAAMTVIDRRRSSRFQEGAMPHDRKILTEGEAYTKTGFAFTSWKKWRILTVIFIVQISMNWNAAIYANAVEGMSGTFGIGKQDVRIGQFIFLLFYAFGCEAWAPFSEEFGRFWIMQISLFLVNIWQIPCALAPNFTTVIVARGLGGLSSAGGSVTLGIVADMFRPAEQQIPLAYIVLSSVGGSVVAPICGGFIQHYLPWQYCFWISLAFGGVTQALHFFIVPETRNEVLLDREAQRLRKQDPGNNSHVYGPMEAQGTVWQRLNLREIATLMWRPYKMLLTEPIVGFLSLLSGFSDAFIFTGLTSFGMVLDKWGFITITKGLSFITLLLAYFVAWATHLPTFFTDRRQMNGNPRGIKPERRMRRLKWTIILLPVCLISYGAASVGPSFRGSWILPLIFTFGIGIVNFDIYMDTVDYMVAAYPKYAASATGGNGFCRDALAGFAALYSEPLYDYFGGADVRLGYFWPTLILAAIGALLTIPVYVFCIKGEWFRRNSKMAMELADAEDEKDAALPKAAELSAEDRGAIFEKPPQNTIPHSAADGDVERVSNVST